MRQVGEEKITYLLFSSKFVIMIFRGMIAMFFSIYEGNIEKVRTFAKKIENKCLKYGADFYYNEIGDEYKEVTYDGHKYNLRFIKVEGYCEYILNGWELIAKLEHTSGGNIVTKVGEMDIPKEYYTISPRCDHCNSNRERKVTFIVRNKKSGEFKQVGRQCLRDYTGISLESALFLASIENIFKKYSNFDFSGIKTKYYFETKELLYYIAATIKTHGYVKKDGINISTSEMAIIYFCADNNQLPLINCGRSVQLKAENNIELGIFNPNSQDVVQLVEDAIQWIKSIKADNDYLHNLQVVVNMEYVDMKRVGILASLIPTYQRMLKEKEEKNSRNTSQFVGNVGDKIEFTIKDAKILTSFEGTFGVTYIYQFTDDNDNIYIWKTSKYLDDLEIIINTTLRATIKEHNTFKGEKQTVLTRCKL